MKIKHCIASNTTRFKQERMRACVKSFDCSAWNAGAKSVVVDSKTQAITFASHFTQWRHYHGSVTWLWIDTSMMHAHRCVSICVTRIATLSRPAVAFFAKPTIPPAASMASYVAADIPPARVGMPLSEVRVNCLLN